MNALIINCSPVRNGATAEITRIVSACLKREYTIKNICIDDFDIKYCKGCRNCHKTGKCIIQYDDVPEVMKQYNWADIIISVSPSYWADIPGQFKVFIDRCTPWCNTHDPHASIGIGKKGYTIALGTGSGISECNKIIESMEHFYGHLQIVPSGRLGLCSIEYKEDVGDRIQEIESFCSKITNEKKIDF